MHRPPEDPRVVRVVRVVRVLHALPGRVRVHVASLPAGDGAAVVEARLRATAGVERARANPKTRTVLVAFDPGRVDAATVLDVIADAAGAPAPAGALAPASVPLGPLPPAAPRAAPPASAPPASAPPASRLATAGQLVVLGLDVALLVLGGGGRRPPRLLAAAPPWLPMALAVARLLLERGLRAAPAAAPSPA